MKIKVVRDDDPNGDGHWLSVPTPVKRTNSSVTNWTWQEITETLKPHVPEGHHIVQLG